MKVQFARTHVELLQLIEKNGIDTEETMGEIRDALRLAGIEWRGHGDNWVNMTDTIYAIRTADRDGTPRLVAVRELDGEPAEVAEQDIDSIISAIFKNDE